MKRFYIDLFSGIGGFALGTLWADLKFDKHFYSEIDDYSCKVYQKRFPEAIQLGDVTKINWSEFKCKELNKEPAQVLVTGGFP